VIQFGSFPKTNPHVCEVTASRHLLGSSGGDREGPSSIDTASTAGSGSGTDGRLDGQAACDGEAHGGEMCEGNGVSCRDPSWS